MRGVLLQAGGPIGTITVVSTILVASFVSASAAGLLLVTASLSAVAVLLVGALLAGSHGRSPLSRPSAAWPPELRTSAEPAAAADERAQTTVAAPYGPLNTYLRHQHGANVVLTFEQIESLLGFPLPALASTERAWWTAPAEPIADHTGAWTVAGRTAAPNLQTRMVRFALANAVPLPSGSMPSV